MLQRHHNGYFFADVAILSCAAMRKAVQRTYLVVLLALDNVQ
jgi:hypothetical protein